MSEPPESRTDEAFADRLDQALEALWEGDGASLDGLLAEADEPGPPVGEILRGVVGPVLDSGLAAGARLGEYTVMREIGRGGMGVVYEAEQDNPRRRVALKVIRGGDLGADEDYRARLFQREVNTLARLKHPRIATIYDAGRTPQGQPFFVMELVAGAPLMDYVNGRVGRGGEEPRDQEAKSPYQNHGGQASGLSCDRPEVGPPVGFVRRSKGSSDAGSAGRLGWQDGLRLFAEICDTIHYAHQRGVIHRDLKPSNILVDSDGQPKVLDFGLARIMDAETPTTAIVTQVGRVVGTLPYMSPEQARGQMEEVDARSDIYSLGVIFYELLTGALPYEVNRSAPLEAARTICEVLPRRPGLIRPSLRGDLDTIALKALEKEPARRYQSAAAFADDLRHYLAHEPIAARPPTAFYQIRMFARRHRALVGGVFATLTALLIGIVGTTSQAIRATRERNRAVQAEQLAEKRRETAEFRAYLANIAAAHAALRSHDVLTARQQLELAPADLRQWEWRYLAAGLDASLMTWREHTNKVWGVAFSSDGRRLASASHDGTIRIRDATSAESLTTIYLDGVELRTLAYSPDDMYLAAGTNKGQLVFWSPETGERLKTMTGHTGVVNALSFSRDGARLASASLDGTARVWNVETGQVERVLHHPGWVHEVALSPDGTHLATSCRDNSARVWDLATGDQLLSVAVAPHTREWDFVHRWGVALSPDGGTLATGGHDGLIKLWDVASGTLLQSMSGHTGRVRSLAYSPDGTRLASASWDCTVRIWDPAAGTELATLAGHEGTVQGLAFSPDGTRLATTADDRTVKLWDPRVRPECSLLRSHESRGIRALAISPDGTKLVSGGEDAVVRLWDASSGVGLAALRGHRSIVYAVAFHPDGTLIASGSQDATVKLWDVGADGEVATLPGHEKAVVAVAFSPDGGRLASAALDGTLRVWDVKTRAALLRLTSDGQPFTALAFSPDGRRLLAGKRSGTIEFWEAADGRRQASLTAHKAAVSCLAFSADGTRLVSSSFDGTLKLWDPLRKVELATPTGHSDVVTGVAFSPDGRRIASVSYDRTLRLWDSATGQTLLSFRGHPDYAFAVAFSPDGTWLASSSKAVHLWETTRPDGLVLQRRVARLAAEELVSRLYHPQAGLSPGREPPGATGGLSASAPASAGPARLEDVLAALEADAGLPADVREYALQIAKFWSP